MNTSEEATLEFYSWETKLRGWHIYEEPVQLELFAETVSVEDVPVIPYDDGKVSLFSAFKKKKTKTVKRLGLVAKVFEPTIGLLNICVKPNRDSTLNKQELLQFLLLLSRCRYQVTFEVAADYHTIGFSFQVYEVDFESVRVYIQSYFPEVRITRDKRLLPFHNSTQVGIVEYGLAEEVQRPITGFATASVDPLKALLSVFEHLDQSETALLQVSFIGTQMAWSEQLYQSVTNSDGSAFFSNAPEMVGLAIEKVKQQLVAATIRLVLQAETDDGTRDLASRTHGAMQTLERVGSNTLIPLSNEGLDYDTHGNDVINCTSHRPGILLNLDELASLVHLPDSSFSSAKIFGISSKSYPVLDEYAHGRYILGANIHDGITRQVGIDDTARQKHMHVIGSTGVGKSSFLVNLAIQDAKCGNGFSVFDPHGDLIDDILKHLPQDRLDDVILFDPSDGEFPIGINLLQARTEPEKVILSSDLVSVFKRQSSSWGDQMNNILSMAVNCFLERDEVGTLVELRYFLQNETFRKTILKDVSDPIIKFYWQEDFPQLRKGTVAPILSRLNAFLAPKAIRYSMAIKEGLDFRDILNQRKILLCKLSQGLIGEDNSHLLGTLIISKLYQAALARQSQGKESRNPHYIYIDEFHNFLTNSMPGIITGVRKYGLGLTLAHQNLEQISRKDNELRSTILGNAFTRIAFRVGDDDARTLERSTEHFESQDYLNLALGEAIGRIGRSGADFNLVTENPEDWGKGSTETVVRVQEQSRQMYSSNRAEVESYIASLYKLKSDVVADTPQEVPKTVEVEPVAPKLDDFEKSKEAFHEKEIEKKALKLHRYLQEAVKTQAQSFGWQATIEYEVPNGRIDVFLHRGDEKVGVEVSVTNKADYEVENVKKCLEFGCTQVFLLVPDNAKQANLKEKVARDLDSNQQKKISVVSQNELTDWLIKSSSKRESEVKTVAGYRVKVEYEANSIKQKSRDTLEEVIFKSLRKHNSNLNG